MNLICYYDNNFGNYGFDEVFNGIYDELKKKYTEHNFEYVLPPKEGIDFGSPGGRPHFQIINPINNKTILLSFWDRGMEIFMPIGWEKYKIIQYIGGLGIKMTSQEIKEKYNIEHIPFAYPIDKKSGYDFISEYRKFDYNPEKKKRKAIFIGCLYGIRKAFYDATKNHPLIEVYDADADLRNRAYYEKMSEYRIALSFTGQGEFTIRDVESIGLKIPLLRSELFMGFYNPFIPNYHYIRASEFHDEGNMIQKYSHYIDQYVYQIENMIDNYDKLLWFSKNGSDYYENYCSLDYMIDLFMKIANINKLQ